MDTPIVDRHHERGEGLLFRGGVDNSPKFGFKGHRCTVSVQGDGAFLAAHGNGDLEDTVGSAVLSQTLGFRLTIRNFRRVAFTKIRAIYCAELLAEMAF